jgi:hypothetical protein
MMSFLQKSRKQLESAHDAYLSKRSTPKTHDMITSIVKSHDWNRDNTACKLLGQILAFAAEWQDYKMIEFLLNSEHCQVGIQLDDHTQDYNVLSGLIKNIDHNTINQTYHLITSVLFNAYTYRKNIDFNKPIHEYAQGVTSTSGGTLAHLCLHVIIARRLDATLLSLLINHKTCQDDIDINRHDTNENSPLMIAICAEDLNCTKCIINHMQSNLRRHRYPDEQTLRVKNILQKAKRMAESTQSQYDLSERSGSEKASIRNEIEAFINSQLMDLSFHTDLDESKSISDISFESNSQFGEIDMTEDYLEGFQSDEKCVSTTAYETLSDDDTKEEQMFYGRTFK